MVCFDDRSSLGGSAPSAHDVSGHSCTAARPERLGGVLVDLPGREVTCSSPWAGTDVHLTLSWLRFFEYNYSSFEPGVTWTRAFCLPYPVLVQPTYDGQIQAARSQASVPLSAGRWQHLEPAGRRSSAEGHVKSQGQGHAAGPPQISAGTRAAASEARSRLARWLGAACDPGQAAAARWLGP